MKRKIIGQGNNTLTITLPRGWAHKNEVKKGDEIEVKEIGSNLVVSLGQNKHTKKTEIDVSNLDHNSIRQKIRSVYKKGYEEISVKFDNNKTTELRTDKEFQIIDVINEEVNLLFGCQIIRQSRNHCIIRDFTSSSLEEFEKALRRVFLLLIDYGEDFCSLAEDLDRSSLAGMRDRHFNIGKMIFYCLRLIHIGIDKDPSSNIYLYYIITTLDDIVDIIKYASVEMLSFKQKKLSKQTLSILRQITNQHRLFYEFFYKPENKKIAPLALNRYMLRKQISSIDGKLPSNEFKIILMMEQILELYYHISEPSMSLN